MQITSPLAKFFRLALILSSITVPLTAEPAQEKAPETAAEKAPEKSPETALQAIKLPGIEINAVERFVDVTGTICLDEGALEVIACTKGTKEHEAIVLVEASPVHIHAALLLVGAKNGNPAMRRAVDKEMTRWVDIPAKGDPIYVSLVWKKEDGTTVERPISDFLERSEFSDIPAEEKAKEKFPDTFLFAGSHLGDPAEKPRKYLAELSGHVISISTFGDELLCLPDFHGQENHALAWQINSTHLPKLNSKVTLRLRTVKPKP
jgi:hypothetical protein